MRNTMPRSTRRLFSSCVLVLTFSFAVPARSADQHALLKIMESELSFSMEKLVSPEGTKPYFIQYAVTDEVDIGITATLGAITSNQKNHSRQGTTIRD